jgi:hypothetical protein
MRINLISEVMKGLSLPIETIVIVLVAVLVLMIIAAFFSGWFGSSAIQMQRETALSNACQQFKTIYNCNPDDIGENVIKYTDIGKPEEDYSVERLCLLLGIATGSDIEDNACLRKCGCVVSTPTTSAPTTTT